MGNPPVSSGGDQQRDMLVDPFSEGAEALKMIEPGMDGSAVSTFRTIESSDFPKPLHAITFTIKLVDGSRPEIMHSRLSLAPSMIVFTNLKEAPIPSLSWATVSLLQIRTSK